MLNIFLDFDGVINTFKPQKDPDHAEFYLVDKKKRVKIEDGGLSQGYKVAWSSELVDDMKKTMFSNPNVTVHWLTSWYSWVFHTLHPIFGFPRGNTQRLNWNHQGGGYGKFIALHEYITTHPDEPFVWIDDELNDFLVYDEGDNGMDLQRDFTGAHLLVPSDTDYGVTKAQWSDVKDFLENYS